MGYTNKTFTLLVMALSMSACSKVNFAPTGITEETTKGIESRPPVIVCGPDQVKVTRPTRVLFVVDQSGSNINGPFEAPREATDPVKKFRGDVMNQFFLSNRDKSNLSWGLTVFNGTSATNLLTSSSNVAIPFTTSISEYSTAMTTFMNRTDVGNTPYKAGLSLTRQIIANDYATAPEYVSYLVVFITDGYPTDYCPNSPTEVLCKGKILENQIDADVHAISLAAPGAVEFSTVYYGKPDSDAAKRLSRMATIGSGQFVDTNTTTEVKLNDILEVEKEVCVSK